MNQKVASILIKQYSVNSTSSFTFDKHSTIYIYTEKSYVYLGMSRLWIETSRSTRYGRRNDVNFHGMKRIRPIGERTIEDCFYAINVESLGVEVHDDEIYVPTGNVRKFIVQCFESFFYEAYKFDKKKYRSNVKPHKCSYKHIY